MRLRLIQLLHARESSVGELAQKAGSAQPSVSKHLNALYDGGLLKRRRQGTTIFYSISDPAVLQICDIVCHQKRTHMRTKLGLLDKQENEKPGRRSGSRA
jgi:DNA-binding transcriptional ArsR family regulator